MHINSKWSLCFTNQSQTWWFNVTAERQTTLLLVLECTALWVRQADGDLLSVRSYSITGLIYQALSCETVTAPYFQILAPKILQLLYGQFGRKCFSDKGDDLL